MKKLVSSIIIIVFILFCIQAGISLSAKKNNQSLSTHFSQTVISPTLVPKLSVTHKNNTFVYDLFYADPPNRLTLIPNFTEKKTSAEILSMNSCTSGINGGFYDTSGNPLGGFTANGHVFKKSISSRLMDGHLSIKGKIVSIHYLPLENADIVLQSGPLLIIDREATTLKIASDEPTRRSVAAITANDELIFIIIYNQESTYEGPYLSDLPQIVNLISEKFPSPIVSAINLDGGNASSFHNTDVTLSELSPIGSMFCLQ